jgi:hypothetical protein
MRFPRNQNAQNRLSPLQSLASMLRMSMNQNRAWDNAARGNDIEDPIHDMPEPPGALGDIVRRMKRRANAERDEAASCGKASMVTL